MKLIRMSDKPVLEPIKDHQWEKAAVFNAAMVHVNGVFHMIYRATDIGGHDKYGHYINTLGYAVSKDLLTWHRRSKPILSNDVPQELRGPEDPRIVKIENTYHMTYTGFGDRMPEDYRICLASSYDLIHWERHGVMLDEPNKNASLFPEKIDGRYCMFHRRHPDIWVCFSDNMKHWEDHKKVMSPIHESWNQARIGIAGPPVKIKDGWFLIFHGVDEKNHYRLGAALLDYKDPTKVLFRQAEPIIEPELSWEINGFIPNVIFSCATVLHEKRVYCCYGGADTVIGMAYIDLKEIKFD